LVDLDHLELKPIIDEAGLCRIYEWRVLPIVPVGKLETTFLEEVEQFEEGVL